MMMRKAGELWCGILVLALAAAYTTVRAQDNYPSSAIKLVWGNPPGGTGDVVARLLAQKLAAQMNASVVVENKPGAGGNIGVDSVSKARPDGYTLSFNAAIVVMSPALGERPGYDIFRDLAPVSLVASVPYLLVAHPGVPANTPGEFIAYLKANPDKLAYSSTGIASTPHLATLRFLQAAGTTALHVPYQGAAQAALDLVAGRIQFRFTDPSSSMPMVRDKRIKVLAYGGTRRAVLLPEVPTITESVMPGFTVSTWFGVLAPAKTPPAIVKRLGAKIARAMQDAELRARLAQEATEPIGSTPEEYGAYLKSEFERWSKVIQSAGVKPES